MKSIILIALAVVAVAVAAPADPPVENLKFDFNRNPDGSYNYDFQNSDQTAQDQVGELRQVQGEDNKPHIVVVVKGSYTYKKEDGGTEQISYTADENGYQAYGDSIPKPVQARR